MKCFEYIRVFTAKDEFKQFDQEMKQLGEDGWEMVNFIIDDKHYEAIFKKEIKFQDGA